MAAAYALAKSEAHSTPPSPSTDAPGAYAGAVSESDEPAPSSSMDVPRGLTSSTPQYSSQSAEWSLSSTDINSEGFIPNFSSTPYQQFNSSTSCDDVEIKFSAEMGSLGLRSTVSDRQTDNSSEQGLHVDIFGARCSGAYSAELEHANEDFLYFAESRHRLDSEDVKRPPGRSPTRYSDFFVKALIERMTLFVSLERGGSIGPLWHTTGTNGDAAGTRSSKSITNGTTDETGD
ncbi:unnamed protein product [Heligmosomoides polygyrus]|uniref:Uncharacterized protein n=1 Tax=Heligmosomoides polygyrus TaxID=6339 RepID=A0A3P7ZSS1_HELPZ|nr:unnamed protein product [Heligmosomoides polygyrus]